MAVTMIQHQTMKPKKIMKHNPHYIIVKYSLPPAGIFIQGK
jgi:hypothetical protein